MKSYKIVYVPRVKVVIRNLSVGVSHATFAAEKKNLKIVDFTDLSPYINVALNN